MTFDELLKQRMSRRQALGRTAAAAIGAGVIAAGAGGYFALTQLGQRPTTVTTPTATVTTPTATVTTPTATVTTPTATTTAPGQVVDLDFVIWTWGVELVQEHVNRFNQAHTTEINVGLSDIAQETYREGLIAKFTGGSPIDLMYSSTEWQTEFEVAGWVTPTEDLFPEVRKYYELIAPGFRPGVLTRDGKMHGLLYYGDHTNFVVNREHLKQIGVEPDPLKSPTWDEVRGWAVELKNKGVAEYPMAAFLGSYGFWQTFSTFVMGQNDPIDQQGIKWIFDEDLNPVMEQNSPIFNAIRWLMDVANTDKTFQPASVNYGDPDIINNVGAGIHSIAWVPTYDFGPINDPANKEGGNIQNVLQPGTGIASAWERPYNVGTTNAKRDRAAQEAMWKLQVFFGGKTDEDLNPVENPTTEGVFRVNKRIMTEVAVPTPYPSLLDDPEYNAAIAKFADPEVYLAQLNKAVVHQVDGEQVPWWGEWSGGWGLGFARVEINGLILGQKGLADSDIMAVLNNIAARWQEYKQSFGGTY
jgi:multiple sugar transport system substrate-binding protein